MRTLALSASLYRKCAAAILCHDFAKRRIFKILRLASLAQNDNNEYRMAKSQKAFRRATLWRSKTAQLFCRIFIAMRIGRMIQGIIRCQTCRLAAKSIKSSIDFAIRYSL